MNILRSEQREADAAAAAQPAGGNAAALARERAQKIPAPTHTSASVLTAANPSKREQLSLLLDGAFRDLQQSPHNPTACRAYEYFMRELHDLDGRGAGATLPLASSGPSASTRAAPFIAIPDAVVVLSPEDQSVYQKLIDMEELDSAESFRLKCLDPSAMLASKHEPHRENTSGDKVRSPNAGPVYAVKNGNPSGIFTTRMEAAAALVEGAEVLVCLSVSAALAYMHHPERDAGLQYTQWSSGGGGGRPEPKSYVNLLPSGVGAPGGGSLHSNRWEQPRELGNSQAGGETPLGAAALAEAIALAEDWGGRGQGNVPDLLLEVELLKYPMTQKDRMFQYSTNTLNIECCMARVLQILDSLLKSRDNFDLWFSMAKGVVEAKRREWKSEGPHHLIDLVLPGTAANLTNRVGATGVSRHLQILNEQWQNYIAFKHFVDEQFEKSEQQGIAAIKFLGRVYFKPLQALCIKYEKNPNLALRACMKLRLKAVDELERDDKFSAGLMDTAGGMTKREAELVAENVFRRLDRSVRGGGDGGGRAGGRKAGTNNGADRPLLRDTATPPLVRDTETYSNGDPIVDRNGRPWRFHVCGVCAKAKPRRFPGHHPDECYYGD